MKVTKEELEKINEVFEKKKQNFIKHLEDENGFNMQSYNNADDDLNDGLVEILEGRG